MHAILTMKSWQAFLFLCWTIILSVFISIITMASGSGYIIEISIFLSFVGIIVVVAWLYAVGAGLESRIPLTVRLNARLFKVNLLYILFYMLFFQIVWPIEGIRLMLGSLTTIFDIYSVVAILDVIYFVSRALVSVEKDRAASLGEYIGPALAILFFPIGIWILQPRIRRIFVSI